MVKRDPIPVQKETESNSRLREMGSALLRRLRGQELSEEPEFAFTYD